MPHDALPAPPELGVAGLALWIDVTSSLELEPGDRSVLLTACRTADRLQSLDDRIRDEGDWDSAGRPSPAVGEHRLQAAALTALLKALRIPHEAPEKDARKYGYWSQRGRLGPA